MKYTISETRLREIIRESIEEGIGDAIKSGFWKIKNVYTKPNWVKRENEKPHNPYTYNKKNFHSDEPEYGTTEYKKMYNADDGWVMEYIQRDIENMKNFLNGTLRNTDVLKLIPDTIEMADEYGLTKYSEYLKKLYSQVKQKINSPSKS